MPWIDELFKKMVELGASDLHMTAGEQPRLRLHGEIVGIAECPPINSEQMLQVLYEITPPRNRAEFEQDSDTDFAYELPGIARFRCNLFQDRTGVGGVFRQIPSEVLSAEKLNLPKVALDLCMLSKGLVVVTGPTGSGKSTTLAALIDHVNRTRTDHIITIEDPIEFVHKNKRCLINQREVHRHTQSFKRALRAALREDPDIVLVGEMRDLETIEIAIETAETGHLVFGTLHTSTAPSTVDRIIDQFPAERQNQIRTMLSSSLKGVIAQTLCKKKPSGRVAALEILIANTAVAANIREGKTHGIVSAMQMGGKLGMRLLNDSLLELVKGGQVDANEAYLKSVNKEDMLTKLSSIGARAEMPAGEGSDAPATTASATAAPRAQAPAQPAARPQAAPPRAPLPAPNAPAPQAPAAGVARAAGYSDPFEQFKKQRPG